MSIWDEGIELLTATDSELAESVAYHSGVDDEPAAWRGVFIEQAPEIVDARQGRSTSQTATLELAATQGGTAIAVAETGKAWFVIRNTTWLIAGVSMGRASLLVTLHRSSDQSIRRPQNSRG